MPEDRRDLGLLPHQATEGIDPLGPGVLGADELPLGPPGIAQQQDQTQSNANAADEAKAKLRQLRGATNAH